MSRRMLLLLVTVLFTGLVSLTDRSVVSAMTEGCDSECGKGTQVAQGTTWNPACNPNHEVNDCYWKQCQKEFEAGCSPPGAPPYYDFSCDFYTPCYPDTY